MAAYVYRQTTLEKAYMKKMNHYSCIYNYHIILGDFNMEPENSDFVSLINAIIVSV